MQIRPYTNVQRYNYEMRVTSLLILTWIHTFYKLPDSNAFVKYETNKIQTNGNPRSLKPACIAIFILSLSNVKQYGILPEASKHEGFESKW